MQDFTGLRRSVERPGALELAIREWQRQLIEMAETAWHQPTPAPPAGNAWCPDGDPFGDA